MTDYRHDDVPPTTPVERTSLSGLTEQEAKEFHRYFTMSFLGFLAIALVAHILTYIALPWGLN